MLLLGFGPTIPVFERTKTAYALDRVATVIGTQNWPLSIYVCTSINNNNNNYYYYYYYYSLTPY
jgi:hypothetical protein